MRRYRFPLLGVVAVACGIAALLLFSQRQLTLRGTLNGLPDLTLPERVPPGGKQVDLLTLAPAERRAALSQAAEEGAVWLWQPIPADTAQWGSLDELLVEVQEHDQRIVAVLPPAQAGEFATRYGAQVDTYQLAESSQSAYEAIHTADDSAEVLTAPIRTEAELQALYDGAIPFDGLTVSLADMTLPPDARRPQPGAYGLANVAALRHQMEQRGDAGKRVWLVDLSWGAGMDENAYTEQAYERILLEWPWAGGIITEGSLPAALPLNTTLWPGIYGVGHPLVAYEGEWEFADGAADFSERNESIARLPFTGDSLGAIIQRGDYRAYLYVEVNGEPAQGLPTEYIDADDVGRNGAYAVLTSPDYQPYLDIIPIAQGYPTQGITIHQATLAAERGWDQFALRGYAVGHHLPQIQTYNWAVGGLLLVMAAAGGGMWAFRHDVIPQSTSSGWVRRSIQSLGARLSAITAEGQLFTLASEIPERVWVMALIAATLVISVSPGVLVTVPALLVLTVLLFLRPTYGPALLLLTAPFYRLPRPLLGWQFSSVELISLVLIAIWALHMLLRVQREGLPTGGDIWFSMHTLDKAVALFVGVAVASLLWSPLLGVAVTELRTMILEPLIAYLLLRTLPFTSAERWRTADALIAAGVLVALIGLGQFVWDVITVRGFVCLRSTLGTCNNAALFMGRLIPIGAAVTLLSDETDRRKAYGAAALLMLGATVLTTSRGGLLLGIPAGVGLVVIMWGGRKAALAVAGAVVAQFLALIPLARLVPRFNLLSQSNLFRVQLWQSTLRMLQDRPITGWGLDQFLYAYRGRYILPAAWQQPDLSQPHNLFLNYWVRLGIFGLAAGIWLQLAFWRMIWRAQRRLKWFAPRPPRALAVGLMGCMAAFLAHGMVDATHFVIDLAFIFFTAIGLAHQLHMEAHHADQRKR